MDSNYALVIFYLLWVVYFIASSLQVKYGFPQAPFKPPFPNDLSGGNVMTFRIYNNIPFLWEMKVILDWTVARTSLDLSQWFKIDDAFNFIFFNRYQNNGRRNKEEYAPQKWVDKFFRGSALP